MKQQRFWASRDRDSDCVQLWRGEKPMPKRHGTFKSEIEAARAYNIAATKYHGEFAYLNEMANG